MESLDYFAIILYLVLITSIGVYLGRFIKNISGFFKGGNAVPWVSTAISNFMTKFSTFIFVAYAGIAYEDGIVAITVIWSTVLPTLIGAFYFAKRWRRANVITPIEYMEKRFNFSVRQLFSWSGVILSILENMVRLYALGIFIQAAIGISLEHSIIISGIIVVLYTMMGGLWAVVVTDVVQFVILTVTTLILVPLCLYRLGGFEILMNTVPDHLNWFNGEKGKPWFLFAYYLMILIKYSGNWTFIQRFYSVKDEKASQKQALLTAAFFLIFPIIFLFPALAARVIIPQLSNPEMSYVSISMELLPPGIMGLMIAAMFAATLSVLSGEYNVTASVLTKDIYERLFVKRRRKKNDHELLWVGRLMTLAMGLLVTVGALFVASFGGAFETNKLITGVFAVPMTVPIVLGIALKRPRPWGAFLSMFAGVILGFILNLSPAISWASATVIETSVCIAVFLISGLFDYSNLDKKARIDSFFKRLNTPLNKDEIPQEDLGFRISINRIYIVTLVATGLMFFFISLPSWDSLAGKMGIAGGVISILIAIGIRQYNKIIISKAREVST